MAEKPEKKPVAAKLFEDVKPSSQVAANKGSKPVIIGHTNIIKDPMVATPGEASPDQSNGIQDNSEDKLMPRATGKELRIEPVSEPEETKPKTEDVEASTEVAEEKLEGESVSEEQSAVSEETNATENNNDDEKSEAGSASGAIDSIVENVNTKKENALADEKEIARLEEIEKLVESKKYFVKISDTPRERSAKLIFGLVVVIFLAVAGWYMMMGPGQDMWLKKQSTDQTATSTAVVTPASSAKTEVAQTKTYNNAANGISFVYPNDWQLSETNDAKIPEIKTVTLLSPKLTIGIADKTGKSVESEVNSRLRIYVQPSKYAVFNKMRSCSSTNIVVSGQNLALTYASSDQLTPQINQVTLASAACPVVDKSGYYNIDNNLKLSTKSIDNRYTIISDYVYTSDYLKKLNPKITEAELALAQNTGLSMTKDEFIKPKTYTQTSSLLDSIKSL